MKFTMIVKYRDGSIGKHSYSQSEIKAKVLESINIKAVRTINVYATHGKKRLKVFHFKRMNKKKVI